MMQINAAKVLLLFRNGKAFDWESLRQVLEKEIEFYSLMRFLPITIENLLEAKLLVAENPADYRNGTLKLSENWWRIQNALGISLSNLAAVDPAKSLFVQPMFERPNDLPSVQHIDLFVLMPFNTDLKGVYEDHIKNVATSLDLKVARADDFFSASAVMKDVWTAICKSRVIIADCTGRNPNVFYEIGLAHTVGKPVILLTQNTEDVPFDLRYIRYIPYQFTPQGMKKFESDLSNTIRTEIRKLEN